MHGAGSTGSSTISEADRWSLSGIELNDDLKLAKLALSQLSYGPNLATTKMVGPGRLELPTLRLSGVRSNHLSYGPAVVWTQLPRR